jgi:hypothetical protein
LHAYGVSSGCARYRHDHSLSLDVLGIVRRRWPIHVRIRTLEELASPLFGVHRVVSIHRAAKDTSALSETATNRRGLGTHNVSSVRRMSDGRIVAGGPLSRARLRQRAHGTSAPHLPRTRPRLSSRNGGRPRREDQRQTTRNALPRADRRAAEPEQRCLRPAGRHHRPTPIRLPPTAEWHLVDTTAWHGGVGAEGGIVADARDEAHFLQALMQGKHPQPTQLAAMKTPAATIGSSYALGRVVARTAWHRVSTQRRRCGLQDPRLRLRRRPAVPFLRRTTARPVFGSERGCVGVAREDARLNLDGCPVGEPLGRCRTGPRS